MEDLWYERLREAYRPATLDILLVGESVPNPRDGARRFFYSPELRIDNLFRSVATAVYGDDIELSNKVALLRRLQGDGFWLIDAVNHPVNRNRISARRAAIASAVDALIPRCVDLRPRRGIIICHSLVYAATAEHLRREGIRVLHDKAIPFPIGNWRTRFVAAVRECLAEAHEPVTGSLAASFRLPTWGGGGLQPGVNLDDSAGLLDIMEEGLSPDKLR